MPQSRRKANQLAQARGAAFALATRAAAHHTRAIISSLILPQEDISGRMRSKTATTDIFAGFRQDAFWRSNDGLTRGDLTSPLLHSFLGKTRCCSRFRPAVALYRTYAGALYTEDGWKNVSTSDFSSLANSVDIAPQNLLASALAASGSMPSTYTLSVQNVSATPQSIWTPPGLITHADEITNAGYVQDTALALASSASASDYTIEAVPRRHVAYSVPNADNGFEKAYKKAAGSADGLTSASGGDADTVRRHGKHLYRLSV